MAYNWKPKYAEVDVENPDTWTTCSRCGFIWGMSKMAWQYDYRGSAQLQNTRVLCCPKCLDAPQPQLMPYILPPDPEPIANARPYPYELAETDWLTTQDGDIITTQDDELLTPSIPNPSDNPNTTVLTALLSYPAGSVSVMYLDLFNGDPASGGVSVLSAITGSAVRTDVAASLTTVSGIAETTDVLTVAAASASTTNVNYVAFYSAALAGTLLVSGPVSATSPTVTSGTTVQFNALTLQIDTN